MQKPRKILATYAELSNYVDDDVSEQELLRLSTLIVESYTRKKTDAYKSSLRDTPIVHEEKSLDEIFREEGWKLFM